MLDKAQVSLRLPARLVEDFDRIAKILGRDRAWVMQKALGQYLTSEGAKILQDAGRLAELDHGKSFDLDDVLENNSAEWMRSSRAD